VRLKKIRDYRHVYATKSSDNLSESALDGILNIRHLISRYFTQFFCTFCSHKDCDKEYDRRFEKLNVNYDYLADIDFGL